MPIRIQTQIEAHGAEVLREEVVLMMERLLADPTLAVTLSLDRPRMPADREDKLLVAEGAARLYLHVLNDRCFGRRFRRGEERIQCVAVAEGMGKGRRLHIHLGLKCPNHLPQRKFSAIARLCSRKVRDLGNINVQPCYPGWYRYLTKEPEAELLWALCSS